VYLTAKTDENFGAVRIDGREGLQGASLNYRCAQSVVLCP